MNEARLHPRMFFSQALRVIHDMVADKAAGRGRHFSRDARRFSSFDHLLNRQLGEVSRWPLRINRLSFPLFPVIVRDRAIIIVDGD